jgi:hypothetical protein
MAVNRNRRTGIEPAHIVRHRAQHIDEGSRIPHGPQPLAGMAFDRYMHRLAAGFPQTPADAVLAEGLNVQLTMARFHGLLNLLFKNP